MMKSAVKAFSLLCLFTLLFHSKAYAAENVPQAVLDLRNSVVRVVCNSTDGEFTGTGFAVGEKEPVRYIVTNYHVIEENPDDLYILRSDGQKVKASVAAQLPSSDLCVLELADALYNIPPVTINDEDTVDAREAIYTLGFPGAADYLSDTLPSAPGDVTITDGIISSVKQLTLVEGGSAVKLFQIDAAINSGNSGGPLVDRDGHVLGVNSYGVLESQNINASISILELTSVLHEHGIAYLSSTGATTLPKWVPFVVPLVLEFLGACITLAVLLRPNGKRTAAGAKKGVPLDAYLAQWGGKLPEAMALHVLRPAIEELGRMHADGVNYLHVCPENILVSYTNQALLRPLKNTRNMALHNGFSAPEQYQMARIGAWSDVYTLSAVLYTMLSGTKLPSAIERQVHDIPVGESLAQAGVSPQLIAVLEKGLSLPANERPQNAVAFLSALGIEANRAIATEQPEVIQPNRPMGTSLVLQAEKGKSLKKRRFWLRLSLAVLVPVLLVGGVCLYAITQYNTAVAFVNRTEYKKAASILVYFPDFFANTKQLRPYAEAGALLQNKEYDKAQAVYRQLGGYLDSKDKIREVTYLEAQNLLNNKKYSDAIKLFQSLGTYRDSMSQTAEATYQYVLFLIEEEDYTGADYYITTLETANNADAQVLRSELDYQRAIYYYNNGQYMDAMALLSDIPDYKDAQSYYDAALDAAYQKAADDYSAGLYMSAEFIFEKLGDYYSSKDYLLLIKAHQEIYSLGIDSLRSLYHSLVILGDFEDTLKISRDPVFTFIRLEGSWKNSKGNYFSLKKDGNVVYNNMPWHTGKYFKLQRNIYFVSNDKKNWKKTYSFSFSSDTVLKIYCYKDKKTLTLYKQ